MYGGAVSLGLPGAKDIGVRPEEAATYPGRPSLRSTKTAKSFVMLPAMSSFYFSWTQQEPPAGYNPTDWSMMFDDAAQQRVIEATRSIEGFCLLKMPH